MKILSKSKIILILALIAVSCATPHKTGFELQREIWDAENNFQDTSDTRIYITGTVPVDSVDVNKVISDVFRVEWKKTYPKEVKLYARVYDSLGRFVTNLADPYKKDKNAKYFTSLKESLGEHYNIRHAVIDSFKVREFGANDSIPYNIALTVDYSGSMSAVLDAIYTGTEMFVSMKYPYDRIALTSFNENFDVKVPLSQDTATILNLYRANKAKNIGNFSGLYDAVWNCMKILENTPEEDPRVIVLFTDGDDNFSKMNLDSIIPRATAKDMHVFVVAFGYTKEDNLQKLAFYTGGKFYRAYSKEDLVKVFKDIYMSLRYHYLITYHPPLYWGYHKAFAGLSLPGRSDTLFASGDYNTAGWMNLNDTIIKPITFDFNKSEIKEESFYILDELADLMYSWPKLRFEIQGHTDNVGTEEYNQKLSERRAEAVYDALIKRGVEPHRLRWRGFGMTRPIESNTTEEGRAKNRRTEFLIIAK